MSTPPQDLALFRCPTGQGDVYLGFNVNAPTFVAISDDDGATFRGLAMVASNEEKSFLDATSKSCYQYVQTVFDAKHRYEFIEVTTDRGTRTVWFNGHECECLGTTTPWEQVTARPTPQTRAIEKALYEPRSGAYYVLTSRLMDLGRTKRGLRLYYGHNDHSSALEEIPIVGVQDLPSVIQTADTIFKIGRPPYLRLIPGRDETTDYKDATNTSPSSYEIDGNVVDLRDVTLRQEQLFAYNDGSLETVTLLA